MKDISDESLGKIVRRDLSMTTPEERKEVWTRAANANDTEQFLAIPEATPRVLQRIATEVAVEYQKRVAESVVHLQDELTSVRDVVTHLERQKKEAELRTVRVEMAKTEVERELRAVRLDYVELLAEVATLKEKVGEGYVGVLEKLVEQYDVGQQGLLVMLKEKESRMDGLSSNAKVAESEATRFRDEAELNAAQNDRLRKELANLRPSLEAFVYSESRLKSEVEALTNENTLLRVRLAQYEYEQVVKDFNDMTIDIGLVPSQPSPSPAFLQSTPSPSESPNSHESTSPLSERLRMRQVDEIQSPLQSEPTSGLQLITKSSLTTSTHLPSTKGRMHVNQLDPVSVNDETRSTSEVGNEDGKVQRVEGNEGSEEVMKALQAKNLKLQQQLQALTEKYWLRMMRRFVRGFAKGYEELNGPIEVSVETFLIIEHAS
ncbi:hypothetical protein HDV00_006085 [Rhizophlyctis rosea]|nr:hypothetical protein HDV00_006085 [Rhizophlyctis rosea]